jgi:hypothetical protein
MNSDQYTIVPHTIENVLSWIRQKRIAIPDIQRPFVWSKTDVRDLIDSLYKGYPVGYIITWHNSDTSIKGGAPSQNKVIMIDGQQRITALRAALEGEYVKTKDYTDEKIVISFNPFTEEFKVRDKSTERGSAWVSDISVIIRDSAFSTRRFIADYHAKNPELTEEDLDEVDIRISRLLNIKNKQVGAIELSALLSIETVTEIFIRINRTGTKLNNADFAMSKIAVHEEVAGDKDNTNPAPDLAKQLVKDMGDSGSIITWNMRFEKSVNEELGRMYPEYAEQIKAINERVADLMIPFKAKWYDDPRCEGSASIKKVLPVVCPELSYKDLGIQDGNSAQRLWMEAVLDETQADQKDQILADLTEYCKMDTWAMVRIW